MFAEGDHVVLKATSTILKTHRGRMLYVKGLDPYCRHRFVINKVYTDCCALLPLDAEGAGIERFLICEEWLMPDCKLTAKTAREIFKDLYNEV